jgi:NAD(P)-dependent dehydrogenase (short-subunit alcohol dehydrogenase family)
MAQRLAGKVAVITGGGGGIGGAVAVDMAAEGAKIVVNDFGKDENGKSYADMVVEKIKKAGGEAVANYDSVSTMEGGANIIKTAVSNFDRIDILVNAAGGSRASLLVDMTEEHWDSHIDAHLKGHFSCSQAAAREMIKQKSGGRIINFSSAAGFPFMDFNIPLFSIAYSTAKAGIMGFTAKAAAELRLHDITVNAIFPNAVTRGFPEERPGAEAPEFVAPILVYLATDEAKNITGQLFTAGGGNLAIYVRPLQTQVQMRKIGKWTLDEIGQLIQPIFSRGPGGPGGKGETPDWAKPQK